jgi:gluconate 2-dehydrogenase gamma chain
MSAQEAIHAYLEKTISRREFTQRLKDVGITAGAAVAFANMLAGCTLADMNNGGIDLSKAPRALTPVERTTLEAMSGRIMPTTDSPGAIEAGAPDYIDIALADAYKPQLARYQRGLAELDRHATATFGKPFAALSAEQQDETLENLEAGKIKEVTDGPQFFELVRRHTMEGFFCEPYYGGNRDMVGWKLVGFPGQRFGYDDAYINKVIDLPPVTFSGAPRRV